MLRINLLPAYLAERRKVRTAIVISVLLVLLVAGGGLGYNFLVLQKQVSDAKAQADQEQALADAQTKYEQDTAAMRSKIAPLKARVDFVDAVHYHNIIRQKIFRQAAAYTYREIELNSMSVQGNVLQMGAYAKSVADIGRFYIYMFGNPDVTAVSITGVPSYAEVQRQTPITYPGLVAPIPPSFKVGLTANLVKSVQAPQLPSDLANGAGGNGGSNGGGPGGPPEGMPMPEQTPAPGPPAP